MSKARPIIGYKYRYSDHQAFSRYQKFSPPTNPLCSDIPNFYLSSHSNKLRSFIKCNHNFYGNKINFMFYLFNWKMELSSNKLHRNSSLNQNSYQIASHHSKFAMDKQFRINKGCTEYRIRPNTCQFHDMPAQAKKLKMTEY